MKSFSDNEVKRHIFDKTVFHKLIFGDQTVHERNEKAIEKWTSRKKIAEIKTDLNRVAEELSKTSTRKKKTDDSIQERIG
jgi:hypothetical protein